MALFCQQIQEAEIILLQAGLIFRAIQMHIDLFNWDRYLKIVILLRDPSFRVNTTKFTSDLIHMVVKLRINCVRG